MFVISYRFHLDIGPLLHDQHFRSVQARLKPLGPSVPFSQVNNKSQVISFLDTKIKNSEDDPDIRWIILKKKIIAL
jgi:hypothetical protein